MYNSIAFTSRRPRTNEIVRKVHRILDVNEGETFCGVELVEVERAGIAQISIPKRWTASESCGTCIARSK